METWRKVWREAIAPQLSREGLVALKTALETDDPTLIQGSTVRLVHNQEVTDGDQMECCPVAYAGWKAGKTVVCEVRVFFDEVMRKADRLVGHGDSRHFLNWWDDSPREVARLKLLEEVNLKLS